MLNDEYIKKFWDSLVTGNNLKQDLTKRKNPYQYESIALGAFDDHLSKGWILDKRFKTKIKLKKAKPIDVAFEDEVWSMVANLGFDYINKDRNFKMPYSENLNLTQQIDVIAFDKETILIIECKATDGERKKGNFKEVIEAIGGKKEGLIKILRQIHVNTKHKIKFIFATKNYILNEQDKTRLENFDIIHFDEDNIKYYQELSEHLGTSAKYQLLGNLCQGQIIPELENKVPAIKGEMGGHTYFSFSIEPEKLLKMGYVLHRNKANINSMPTYQRLIKKARLREIQEFVDSGNFFPNSIIINVNTFGKRVNFDLATPQCENAISKIGILHLPRTYRSAFIIDGQHRLYGYANSKYKSKNTIPVVAFIDMDKWDQVRLFQQINENQKSVSKSLRNDLDADLLWDSDNPKERIKALKLNIAKNLGEDFESPLYDRVQLGENPKTDLRCISTETIRLGLDRSNFFPVYSKNAVIKDGSFYRGNNDETYKVLYPFLLRSFSYLKNELETEWNKGEKDGGFLAINAGIESFLRLFSDLIDHLVVTGISNPKQDKADDILKEMSFYLDPLIDKILKLTEDEKQEFKRSYGTSGKTKYWRRLQKIVNENRPDFMPEGLENYWKNEAMKFNTASIEMIRDIETHFKKEFKVLLESYYGNTWFKKGIPPQVQESATLMALQKNREIENPDEEKKPWDCLNIIDYRKIAVYGANWRDIFESKYTQPGLSKKSGNKEEKTSWMARLERIRNVNFHEYSVKEDEYEFLCEIHNWLIKDKIDLKKSI